MFSNAIITKTYQVQNKNMSFGSLLAAPWKQFTLIIMNHETYESRNFQIDTSDNLVHIIIFVTKWSTRYNYIILPVTSSTRI
jgi:hypothetical protein